MPSVDFGWRLLGERRGGERRLSVSRLTQLAARRLKRYVISAIYQVSTSFPLRYFT